MPRENIASAQLRVLLAQHTGNNQGGLDGKDGATGPGKNRLGSENTWIFTQNIQPKAAKESAS